MKNLITKDIIDNSIKSSDNLEGLLTILLTTVVTGIVAKLVVKKSSDEKEAF